MVNRLIEPTCGRILIDGVDAATRDVTELRRSIGYVIQQVGLFPHQTIGENVATVPRLLGWPEAPPARADGGAARPGRPRAGDVSRSLPCPAVGRRAPAGRGRPGARRRSTDHAHGRALRRRRPDRARSPPERVPAPPGRARQDDPVRDPRHRRGDQDGRPRGRHAGRRRPRPVRHPGRDPGRRRRPTSWPASSARTAGSSGWPSAAVGEPGPATCGHRPRRGRRGRGTATGPRGPVRLPAARR